MKLVKRKSKETYDKGGSTYHYTNYYLVLDNGKYIQIKPAYTKDNSVYKMLDLIAYEEK